MWPSLADIACNPHPQAAFWAEMMNNVYCLVPHSVGYYQGDAAMKAIDEILSLAGKAAIVTGGAKGIGYGISYRLAEAGAKVLIADTDIAMAEMVAGQFNDRGWEAVSVQTDVSVESEVKRMVVQCRDLFWSVDVLVNKAGIYPNQMISDMSQAAFDRVIQVNLRSVFLTTKYVSEVMIHDGRCGKIINVTSIDALHPTMVGLGHYDASKHGVWGFTKNSALELAPYNIWVNAIAPGGIATPGIAAALSRQKVPNEVDHEAVATTFMAKIPMQRMGEPDDIGKVALFLASDMASYMTGSQIVVDGGVLLS